MANLVKAISFILFLGLAGAISIADAQYGNNGRGTPVRSSFRDDEYRTPQFRVAPAAPLNNNVNNGVVKALEARISAMEELIREYEEKEVVIREREYALEQNRLALEKRMREEEKRIREREIGLEKREAEITAYHNQVLQEQDQRERHIEVLSRKSC